MPSLIVIIVAALPALATESQKLDAALEAEIRARVDVAQSWAADRAIVRAVREANETPRTMTEIEAIDAKWIETVGVDEFMRGIIDHPAAERLRELRASHPALREAILTDRLGANVASTNKTSDFYQGDEEKFREAFNDAKGGVYVGSIYRDESIQSYSVPIGVPVLDEGRVIGVLVITLSVEKLKRMMESK